MERVLNLSDEELAALAKLVYLGEYVAGCCGVFSEEDFSDSQVFGNACRTVYKMAMEQLPDKDIVEADETYKRIFRLSEHQTKEMNAVMDAFREENFRVLVCISATDAEHDAVYGPRMEKDGRCTKEYGELYVKNLREIKANDLKNLRLLR